MTEIVVVRRTTGMGEELEHETFRDERTVYDTTIRLTEYRRFIARPDCCSFTGTSLGKILNDQEDVSDGEHRTRRLSE